MSTMSFKYVSDKKDIHTLPKEELYEIRDFLNNMLNMLVSLDMCDHVDDQFKEVESDLLLVEELLENYVKERLD